MKCLYTIILLYLVVYPYDCCRSQYLRGGSNVLTVYTRIHSMQHFFMCEVDDKALVGVTSSFHCGKRSAWCCDVWHAECEQHCGQYVAVPSPDYKPGRHTYSAWSTRSWLCTTRLVSYCVGSSRAGVDVSFGRLYIHTYIHNIYIYVLFWPFGIFFSSGRGLFLVLSALSHAGSPPGSRTQVWPLAEVRVTCSGGSKLQLRSGRDS